MILLSDYSDEQVSELAEKIRTEVKDISGAKQKITISVGATKHLSDESVLATINRADSFLYQAKDQGKDRVCSDL